MTLLTLRLTEIHDSILKIIMTKKSNTLLHSLQLPSGLKSLTLEEYEQLAIEIRQELIDICNTCGGHLASNLGVVELTIALHSIFDSPKDKLVFDTTHQCYVHKMLTGRLDKMHSIRQEGGLSGFAKISESDHDSFGAGHASTSLSAALGMAHARNIKKENYAVVSIVGDASLSGGMAYEAINNVGKLSGNFICILNDNNMSISRPVGNMSTYITQLRTSSSYTAAKDQFERIFKKIPKIGNPLLRKIEKTIDRMRNLIIDVQVGAIFEEFGFRYLGPIDGHNIPMLMGALNYAKSYNGPIMIHIITTKGKGHTPAEDDPIKFHGVSPKAAPAPVVPSPAPVKKIPTYTEVFGSSVCEIASQDPNVVVITPAMKGGSGLDTYAEKFPSQFFDVGIAEEHAITFAAGLSRAGVMPIVAIYSTFLQRGYDQLIHDVCLQKLPMVLALDRAGLVGEDGATHHGVFDYAFELHIPNITILAPKNGAELTAMLNWAVTQQKIISIRYPKGPIPDTEQTPIIGHISQSEIIYPYSDQKSAKCAIIAIGSMVEPAKKAAELAIQQGHNVSVINLRSVKPLDTRTLLPIISQADHIITVEEGCKIGGVGTYIRQELGDHAPNTKWHLMGIDDEFVDHGKIPSLRNHYNLNAEGILAKITSL